MININFKFKNCMENNWQYIHLSVEDYFDLEKCEKADIWSVPKSNNLLDYIEIDNNKVELIIVSISDTIKNESVTFKQTFWNNQRNSLVETIEKKNNVESIELIIETLVKDNLEEEIWEIFRISRKHDVLIPTLHTFITENKEGYISEKIIL